jgi:hypothetical protein
VTQPAILVFLNGKSADAIAGGTLLDLVARHDPGLGELLRRGDAVATDGRGVAAPADAPVTAGAIFRVYRSARGGHAADA